MAVRLETKHINETLPELVRLIDEGLTAQQVSEKTGEKMGVINRLLRDKVDPVTRQKAEDNLLKSWGR